MLALLKDKYSRCAAEGCVRVRERAVSAGGIIFCYILQYLLYFIILIYYFPFLFYNPAVFELGRSTSWAIDLCSFTKGRVFKTVLSYVQSGLRNDS